VLEASPPGGSPSPDGALPSAIRLWLESKRAS
jgi:hypothetical protein